jgi:uncharacterized damage-inducible protein DinB
MSLAQSFLQELEAEAQITRRLLERVPQAHLGWKPHQKSMTLGQLARHVATTPGGVAEEVAKPAMEVPSFEQPSVTHASELLPLLDESVARAHAVLSPMDDVALATIWRVVDGDRELLAMPRAAFVRSIMLNHWYHHRGQLSVYLRQLNVPLPSIYGPSADENPFVRPQTATAGG